MKKKFSALSTLFLLGGGTSLFLTGCQKDYDGQLEILRNQIQNGAVNLDQLNAKITLIQTQITTLEEALKQAEANQKEEIQKLIDQLNEVKTELSAKTDDLQKQMDEAKTDIQTLKDRITAAEQEFNNKLLEISKRIDQLDSKLNVLDGRIAKLEGQLESIQAKQDAVEATIQGLQKEIEELKNQPGTPDLTDRVKKLEDALKALQQVDQELEGKVSGLNQLITQVKEAAEQKDAQLEQLINQCAEKIANMQLDLDSKIEQITTKITDLSIAADYLLGQVDALNLKYNVLEDKVVKLQQEYTAEIKKIWEAINQGGSTEEIQQLKDALAKLEKQQQDFAAEVKKGLETVLTQQQLLGTRVDTLEESVQKNTESLQELKKQLSNLQKEVAGLSAWKEDFVKSYQMTINEIKKQLENLPEGGDTNLLQQQLDKMQQELLQQSQKLDELQNNQEGFNQALTELRSEMNALLLTIQQNYKEVLRQLGVTNDRIDQLADFIAVQNDNLNKLNKDLVALTDRVSLTEQEIVTLNSRLEQLEGKSDGFVTLEQVQSMLREYQVLVEQTLQVMLDQLKEKPNKSEVEQMIKNANQQLQSQIDAMKTEIMDIKGKIAVLEKDIADLLIRVQSMQLIPDYSDGLVKLVKLPGSNNEYQLTLKVKVNPEYCINDIVKKQHFITVNSQPVIPVRAAQSLPVFKVSSAKNLGNGIMEVTATANNITITDGEVLPFQVSVVLSDYNNDRTTDFAAVRYSASAKDADQA